VKANHLIEDLVDVDGQVTQQVGVATLLVVVPPEGLGVGVGHRDPPASSSLCSIAREQY